MTPRHPLALLLTVFLFFPPSFSLSTPVSSAQKRLVTERLRGVLSQTILDPQLHGDGSIKYSPDGNYLLVQDGAGVMLFSRNPLRLVTYINAPLSYPARFSADSKTLVILSFDLFLSRWSVTTGTQLESPSLTIPGGCLSATLSPVGDLLGCYTPDLQLAIYRLENAKKLFSGTLHSAPTAGFGIPVPFDFSSDFSAPFGFFVSNSMNQFANRGLFHFPVLFSPDEKFLIAGDDSSSLRLNLSAFTKENFSSPLHKRTHAITGIAPDDRVLLLDRLKSEPPAVAALSTGETITSFSEPVDSATLCTNARFAVFRKDSSVPGVQLADLTSKTIVPITDALAADAYANEIAVLRKDDTVLFFQYGKSQALTGAKLPLASMPPLRTAAVDADLSTLALSVDGKSGVFDVTSGKLLLEQKTLSGARIADPKHALLITTRRFKSPHQILRGDFDAKSSQPSWTAQADVQLLPGEANFLEYSFANEIGRGMLINLDRSGVAFSLRGLNPASGAQAWRMKFETDIPIPFSDPQGTRFVLGWRAKDDKARNAIKNNPAILDAYKHSKRMEQDTVFEVFDAATGKSLGGVFVQFGDGPINFTSAFSAGDFVFLVKDTTRLTVLSLRDGRILLHAKGYQPTPSAEANLLALDEGYGRLGVYDLSTGKKLEQQQFLDAIAYKHFSDDGKKLLVLTQHQKLFVLDMSEVRQHPLPLGQDSGKDTESDSN